MDGFGERRGVSPTWRHSETWRVFGERRGVSPTWRHLSCMEVSTSGLRLDARLLQQMGRLWHVGWRVADGDERPQLFERFRADAADATQLLDGLEWRFGPLVEDALGEFR